MRSGGDVLLASWDWNQGVPKMMENPEHVPFLGMLNISEILCLGSDSREFLRKKSLKNLTLQETILKISGLSKSELAAFDANVHGPIESLGMFDGTKKALGCHAVSFWLVFLPKRS